MTRTTVALWTLAALAPGARSQQIRELPSGYLIAQAIDAQDVLAADFDGDKNIDLWVAVQPRSPIYDAGQDRLYLGQGGGRFSEATTTSLPRLEEFAYNVRAGDLDGDGDLDVVTAGTQLRVYLNDGRAKFTEHSATAIPARWIHGGRTVELLDADGDGDLDLITVALSWSALLLNDGKGRFREGTAPPIHTSARRLAYVLDTAVADLTGDGRPDLVAVGIGVLLAFRGDGKGGFVEIAGLPPVASQIAGVSIGDLDGDNDLDMLLPLAGNPQYQPVGAMLLANDGAGRFTDVSARMPRTEAAATSGLADVDGDGDLDAFLSDFATLTLYENDGKGVFRIASPARQVGAEKGVWRFRTADVDGDAVVDVVTLSVEGVAAQVKLWFGETGGGFRDATRPLLPFRRDAAYAVRLADLDGDGDADMVRANASLMRPLYLNDGSGRFESATATHMPGITNMSIMSVAVGDVDGDGDPDVLLARFNRTFMLYRNSGRAMFAHDANASIPDAGWWPMDTELVDLNRDGKLDLVCAIMGQNRFTTQNELYFGDGRGSFTRVTGSHLPADQEYSQRVAIGDVDRDGDLDLFFADVRGVVDSGRDLLYLNDGTGGFGDASTRLPLTRGSTLDAALADVDRDGDPDLALATYHGVRLWLNDGKGTFTDASSSHLPAHGFSATAVRAAGVLHDGVPDLVFVSRKASEPPRFGFFLNLGNGRFVDRTSSYVDDSAVVGNRFAAADVDEDGDVDLVEARVRLNLRAQVATPLLVRLGRPFRIDALSPIYTAALPMIGLIGFTPKVGLPGVGKLGVDPGTALFLPAQPLVNGSAHVEFGVPLVPGLVGLRLFTQVVFAGASGGWQLSNTESDRIGW